MSSLMLKRQFSRQIPRSGTMTHSRNAPIREKKFPDTIGILL
jgi:hypothetical protein